MRSDRTGLSILLSLEDDSSGLHCIHCSAYARYGSGTAGKAICFQQFYVCILIPSFSMR
jgi:hypothetical protein